MDAAVRQHLDAMQVRQPRIVHGDTKWYVTTANGFVVSEGYLTREGAEEELATRRHDLEAMDWEDS